jgi:hypothetical protein
VTDWANVGKVFGVLGTGKKNTTEGKGFRTLDAAAVKNYMYLSCFPSKFDATVANTIVFKAKYVDFMTEYDLIEPSRPGAAADPDSVGAAMLAASVTGFILVSASLY